MLYNVIEDTEKIKARPQNVDVFLVLWESNPRFRGGGKSRFNFFISANYYQFSTKTHVECVVRIERK